MKKGLLIANLLLWLQQPPNLLLDQLLFAITKELLRSRVKPLNQPLIINRDHRIGRIGVGVELHLQLVLLIITIPTDTECSCQLPNHVSIKWLFQQERIIVHRRLNLIRRVIRIGCNKDNIDIRVDLTNLLSGLQTIPPWWHSNINKGYRIGRPLITRGLDQLPALPALVGKAQLKTG